MRWPRTGHKLFGVSYDERQRRRIPTDLWTRCDYPLCETRLSRLDCVAWLEM